MLHFMTRPRALTMLCTHTCVVAIACFRYYKSALALKHGSGLGTKLSLFNSYKPEMGLIHLRYHVICIDDHHLFFHIIMLEISMEQLRDYTVSEGICMGRAKRRLKGDLARLVMAQCHDGRRVSLLYITINLDTNTPIYRASSLPQIWQDHQNTVVNQMQCIKVYKFQLLQILTTCTCIHVRIHACTCIWSN